MSDQRPNSDLVAAPRVDLEELIARALRRWLPLNHAGPYSGLSEKSLRRLIAAGKLTAYRPVKGKILLDRFELDAYIASSTTQPRKGRGIS